jgi:lysozyme
MKRAWSILWAARFIAKWEGFLGTAYLDTIASPPVWTIGYGHTGGVHAGESWSKPYALKVLGRDCRSAGHSVRELVKHRLTVRQRIALISFVFNLGPGVLPGSELLRALNAGEMTKAARLMLAYDHAGGVVVQGLSNRRHAEAWLMTHSKAHQSRPTKPTKHDHPHTKARKRSL